MEFYDCTSLTKHPLKPEFYAHFSNNRILSFSAEPKFKELKSQEIKGLHDSKGRPCGICTDFEGNIYCGSFDGRLFKYKNYRMEKVKLKR